MPPLFHILPAALEASIISWNESVCVLCFSELNDFAVWGVSNAVERRDACRVLAGKLGGKRPHLEYTAIGGKLILKVILWKSFVGGGGVGWIRLAQDRDSCRGLANVVMNLRVA